MDRLLSKLLWLWKDETMQGIPSTRYMLSRVPAILGMNVLRNPPCPTGLGISSAYVDKKNMKTIKQTNKPTIKTNQHTNRQTNKQTNRQGSEIII